MEAETADALPARDGSQQLLGGTRPLLLRLAPPLVFVGLASVTLLVWWQLLQHRRRLVRRHAEDICVQASRRIEVLVESRLRVAEVFARRWSSHETRDFSRRRFDRFARVLATDLPGYWTLRLIPAGDAPHWVVPRRPRSAWSMLDRASQRALIEHSLPHRARLSRPAAAAKPSGTAAGAVVFAALRLERESELLGHLVVALDAGQLIGSGFDDRIRSEFNLRVDDGSTLLFSFANDDGPSRLDRLAVHASRSFALRNRRWRVTVAPRSDETIAGWDSELAVPTLGLLLSVGFGLLVHQLGRRMALYRSARDRALSEITSREQAERALRESEARYRSVFDSATDGLVVLEPDGQIVDANLAAATMHGYEAPSELIGRPVTDLIEPGSRDRYELYRQQMRAKGRAQLESLDQRHDGSTLDVEVRGTRLDQADQRSRLLAIITDVTQRKQAQRRQALLSRKVLMAQEEERARVSRDLHDELGQILTALKLEIHLLRKRAAAGDTATRDSLTSASQMVTKAADELRRICRGLRPPLLDDLGLEPAVRLLIDEFGERTGLPVDLDLRVEEAADEASIGGGDEGGGPLSAEVSLCAYRVVQESLNNIRRHAGATEVAISLVVTPDELLLSVYDDGRGFDVTAAEGYGIAGMRERASLVGGDLEVRSVPGEGTRVVFALARPARGGDDDQGADRR